MQPSALAAAMATDLRPILRHTAQQLTLLGSVVDLDDFSTEWLGEPDAYVRLSGLDMLELASAVNCLELGLGILVMVLHTEWDEAATDRDRWQANARLTATRTILRNLRTWKRQQRWRDIGLDASLQTVVGENVRAARVMCGLSQAELSSRSGVSLRYLREIEHGRANVRLSVIEKLAVALGTTSAELATPKQNGC